MVGRRLLRKYLRDTGQRASDVVRAGGFDDGLFSRWLSGQRTPSLRNAIALQEVTGGAVPSAAWLKKARK